MTTLQIDVINCILAKLPAKSLGRFKSVSKSWQTLISSPAFIRLHHQQARSSDTNGRIVFIGNCHTLHLHQLNSSLSPPILCPCSCPRRSDDRAFCRVKIVASTEFFLLTRCDLHKYSEFSSRLILLNPTTGSYYTLPYDNKKSFYRNNVLRYGLCFDEADDDYKVVRLSELWKYTRNQGGVSCTTHREVVIYSFRKKLWKKIEKTLDTFYYIRGDVAVTGRFLHTIFHPYDNDLTNGEDRIGCFDIVAEQWTNDVALPPIHNLKNFYLSIFEGMLCVLGNDKEAEAATGSYSVWVMKEYGIHDSWVMLMSIVSHKIYRPIAYREGSKHELLCIFDERFYWFNLRGKEITRADFYEVPGDGGRLSSGHICKGSLVHFPGGQRLWPIKARRDRRRLRLRKRFKPKSLPKQDTVARKFRGR